MRHPLHSICPYFAMFPEDFVARQIYAYTKRGDTVFDPFSGRGTTVFESLLNGRPAAGVDVNPVAACISGAKADTPTLAAVNRRLQILEDLQRDAPRFKTPSGDFFRACFHPRTPPAAPAPARAPRLATLTRRPFHRRRLARLSPWRIPQVSELSQQPHAAHDQHKARLLGALVDSQGLHSP